MTNKSLRSKYKGIKWINTRYSNPYKMRMNWKRFQAISILSHSLSTINNIRQSASSGATIKLSKALAIAKTIVDAQMAVSAIGWKDKAVKQIHQAGDAQSC